MIGLTGGIASGKTTIAKMFAELGANIIDADELARQVVLPGSDGLNNIVAHFGQQILQPDGTLDRRKLRNIVFHSTSEKQWLNTELHPRIRNLILSSLAQPTQTYHLLVVPLLFENGLADLCQRVCVVDVAVATQIARAKARDQDQNNIELIIAAQIDRTERLGLADDIISNEHSTEKSRQQVINLHNIYLNLLD